MKFFVPGEEDAEAALERMRQARGAPGDTRPIYSMTYDEGRTEIVATVGRMVSLRSSPGPRNSETVGRALADLAQPPPRAT